MLVIVQTLCILVLAMLVVKFTDFFGTSLWIAPLKWTAPALGVGVGAACKGPLKGRFKGPFKGRIRQSEGSDGHNAEL